MQRTLLLFSLLIVCVVCGNEVSCIARHQLNENEPLFLRVTQSGGPSILNFQEQIQTITSEVRSDNYKLKVILDRNDSICILYAESELYEFEISQYVKKNLNHHHWSQIFQCIFCDVSLEELYDVTEQGSCIPNEAAGGQPDMKSLPFISCVGFLVIMFSSCIGSVFYNEKYEKY